MQTLIAVPILAIVLMLQTVVVGTLPLLSGYADLVLLVLVAWSLQERVHSAWAWALIAGALVGYISAAPLLLPVFGYLSIVGLVYLVRLRVWQSPILGMFLVTFLGSLITQGSTMGYLLATGTPIGILDSLNLVILPATLLNILLALPIYAIITDLAQLVYPEEVEV